MEEKNIKTTRTIKKSKKTLPENCTLDHRHYLLKDLLRNQKRIYNKFF
uniref:Uncharacterized protein n=1 Tax=Meloidogyne enterolobii TaxID=390850 RepID=A0A6V7XZC1_MELEN|nr:unnamed protein product [Meloidogyne enterolobii]